MNLSEIKNKITAFLKNIKPVYLIIIIVLILIIEIIWAFKTMNNFNPLVAQTLPQPTKKVILNVISLNTDKNDYKIGEKIPVSINVSSNKNIAGADLIIKYDPNLLSIVTNADKTPVAVGAIFDDYPVNMVDEKNGVITISGTAGNTAGVIPKGVFGTIVFQGKAVGKAKVFLDFVKNSTNDTNLIENQSAQDVLEEVKNLDLKITP